MTACVRVQVAASEVQALRSATAAVGPSRPSSLESQGRLTTIGSHSRGLDAVNAGLYGGASCSPQAEEACWEKRARSTPHAWE